MTFRSPSVLAVAAFAGAAAAQDCVWNELAAGPGLYGEFAYHTALGRVVFVEEAYPSLRVWAWDGAAWTLVNSQGPPSRAWYKIADDSIRHRLVLFGGSSASTHLVDTWEWDGSAWMQVALTGPPPRSQHAM